MAHCFRAIYVYKKDRATPSVAIGYNRDMIKTFLRSLAGKIVIASALCLIVFFVLREINPIMCVVIMIAVPCCVFDGYGDKKDKSSE
jgi:hypothetical protein